MLNDSRSLDRYSLINSLIKFIKGFAIEQQHHFFEQYLVKDIIWSFQKYFSYTFLNILVNLLFIVYFTKINFYFRSHWLFNRDGNISLNIYQWIHRFNLLTCRWVSFHIPFDVHIVFYLQFPPTIHNHSTLFHIFYSILFFKHLHLLRTDRKLCSSWLFSSFYPCLLHH